MSPRTMRHRQAGLSLISLMVGMVISLMAVLGALALYRSTTQTVFGDGGLVRSSMQDGQLASGLLSAQIALQGAGFGLAAPSSGTHFLLLTNALLNPDALTLSGTPVSITAAAKTGNAVVWISNPNVAANSADYRCSGLVSDPSTRALYLIQSSGACSPLLTQWDKITWLRRTLVESSVLTQAVSLTVQKDSACWPFGAVPQAISKMAAPTASVMVKIGYGSSVTGSSNTYTSCLANLSS
ncbi:PilW family protein [Roseateles sp.]|uniref:PilW family protein n=1 Tax=Roseateles sp. TaxID=1971397 RepID=UPI003BA480A8